ncbi:hypothetical protein MKW92_012280, partial [Papaver armeniacum]
MLANNIGGLIPMEIVEIVTLKHLVLTDNQLEGPIPPELGKLTRLKTFRMAGTSFSGEIPDFLGNWTKLVQLDMRGTSMEGPIPSTIFHLKNLTTFCFRRVSDLKGPNMPFPDLRDMNSMDLRNCMINGSIASNNVEIMPGLMKLDLSFNRLTGDIQGLQEIPSLQNMYLTNNSLTVHISAWITNVKHNFDLSYNNFTGTSQSVCQISNLNKISSYSSEENQS